MFQRRIYNFYLNFFFYRFVDMIEEIQAQQSEFMIHDNRKFAERTFYCLLLLLLCI